MVAGLMKGSLRCLSRATTFKQQTTNNAKRGLSHLARCIQRVSDVVTNCTNKKLNVASSVEGSEEDIASDEVDQACSIRLEVEHIRRRGRYKHTFVEQQIDIKASAIHHKDSKPAQWGVTTM
jgi:hypothetical protein